MKSRNKEGGNQRRLFRKEGEMSGDEVDSGRKGDKTLLKLTRKEFPLRRREGRENYCSSLKAIC